jgi:hypothetical protein
VIETDEDAPPCCWYDCCADISNGQAATPHSSIGTHLRRRWVVPALLLSVALLTISLLLLGVSTVLLLLMPILLVSAVCQWRGTPNPTPGPGDDMGSRSDRHAIPHPAERRRVHGD